MSSVQDEGIDWGAKQTFFLPLGSEIMLPAFVIRLQPKGPPVPAAAEEVTAAAEAVPAAAEAVTAAVEASSS